MPPSNAPPRNSNGKRNNSVPLSNVYANRLLFNEDGSFHSHDTTQPTSRKGGKAKVVADLKAKHGYETVVMIGDGATDLEAREIEGGADFSEMAVKFSTCNSAARGGKLGKFTPGQMVKEFDEAVFMTYDTGRINPGNEAFIYEPK